MLQAPLGNNIIIVFISSCYYLLHYVASFLPKIHPKEAKISVNVQKNGSKFDFTVSFGVFLHQKDYTFGLHSLLLIQDAD